ncbi:DUF2750 domain-containing protein [Winogradskyella sp. 4-2091]|uniref:DUF2750 domain-containing protein n=1 Tax=Winogradskyella sp. 4-2091 TaxID=3381659 RepID=UPI003891C8A6
MGLHPKKIENILKLDSFSRYKYFLKKVADFECFWSIMDKNEEYVISNIENNQLISFWSNDSFIKVNSKAMWQNCTPVKIDLDNFEDVLIPLIKRHNLLINVFPVNHKSGFVVNIDEFIRDLNDELEFYI